MRYRVLGPLEIRTDAGTVVPCRGRKQRRLLAALLLHAPRVASVDRLVDILWDRRMPDDPTGALQTQVSRLRTLLREAGADADAIASEPYGYRLSVEPDAVDAVRFERLVTGAREAPTAEAALEGLERALDLWRGRPYEEFADLVPFQGGAARLRELRTAALERRVECLLALGRTDDARIACDPLVQEDPLREKPRALLMEALYRSGRQSEALDVFQVYRRLLSEELGLDPSPALRQLEVEILRHDQALAPASGRDRAYTSTDAVPGTDASPVRAPVLKIAYCERAAGGRIAYAEAGAGPPMLVLPAWICSLAAVGSGSDPRSALLARLAERFGLCLYDRFGMGLSAGPAERISLETDIDEVVTVLDAAGIEKATLLAMSQAGPPALAFAARHPDRVARLILLGTYASGARTFPRQELRESMLALVRASWGIGSKVISDLVVPDATAEEAKLFARVQRESATPELAARALEQFFAADVTELLPSITCPALIIHYTGDRAVPFAGGQDLAARLPDARLFPIDARAHLPRSADVDHITDLITDFAGG